MSEFLGTKKLKSIYYYDNNGTRREIIKRLQDNKIVFQKVSEFVPLNYLEKIDDSELGYVDLGYNFMGDETVISVIFGINKMFGISGSLLGSKDINTNNVFKVDANDYPNPLITISYGQTDVGNMPAETFLLPDKKILLRMNLHTSYDPDFGNAREIAGYIQNSAGEWELKKTYLLTNSPIEAINKGNLYAFASHQINEFNADLDKPTDFLKYGKIYNIQIHKRIKEPMVTSLFRNYVPKRQVSTNKVGFYDTVTKKFYPTIGDAIIGK